MSYHYGNTLYINEDFVWATIGSDFYVRKEQSLMDGVWELDGWGKNAIVNLIAYTGSCSSNLMELFLEFGKEFTPRHELPMENYEYAIVDMRSMIDIIKNKPLARALIERKQEAAIDKQIKAFCLSTLKAVLKMESKWQAAMIIYMHCASFNIKIDDNIDNFLEKTEEDLDVNDMIMYDDMVSKLYSFLGCL